MGRRKEKEKASTIPIESTINQAYKPSIQTRVYKPKVYKPQAYKPQTYRLQVYKKTDRKTEIQEYDTENKENTNPTSST